MFALTLVIGARLAAAVVQVAIATRRRRAHHRMVVDLVGQRIALAQVCTQVGDLRILDVKEPLAYCLPGVRSRVVVSEGTLNTLADNEIAAILTHERAHLRARHDLVLEMFTAVHAAFPASSAVPTRWTPSGCSSNCSPTTPPCALRVPLRWPVPWSRARPDTRSGALAAGGRPPSCGCAASAGGPTACCWPPRPTLPRPRYWWGPLSRSPCRG